MNILIVDDNAENIYLLEALLKGNGYEVVIAGNGLEALGCLKTATVGLVISDILMPKMDGFQLCRAVRSDEQLSSIPFIFYTATYTDEKDAELGIKLGADRFLVKPQDTEVILTVIKEVLSEHAPHPVIKQPLGAEMEFFRQYNEILFHKLEKKVTDLEVANRALLESETRFRSIFDQSPVAYQSLDEEGKFLYVNDRLCRLLQYDSPELIGRSFSTIWPPETKPRFAKTFADFKQNGEIHSQLQLVRKDGSPIEVYIEGRIQSDASSKFISTHCVFFDITERRRAESEKILLENQLRQAQKMEAIGQLAGGVAHDFNNIMSAIVGYAAIALMKMKQDDPNRHSIEQIQTAANRATVLTQSLLAFGRKQNVNLVTINLNDVILKFEKFLLRLLKENIRLKVETAEKDLHIVADRGQLEQILMNLVTNSRDAMPKGGDILIKTGLINVDQSLIDAEGVKQPSGIYAFLTVTDTGTGMTDEVKQKIFEPFYTTKEEGKGTGLGLAVVFGIVKQHNGFINVCSNPGRGTTFKIYLPSSNGSAPAESQKMEEEVPARGGTETLLFAEDDATIRKMSISVLQEYGYTVIEAVDGLDAVAKYAKNIDGIRLVMLDGIMPNMNGKEAWLNIKKQNPEVKTIFISGYAENIFTKKMFSDKNTVFLQKPVTPTVLVRKIRDMLDTQT